MYFVFPPGEQTLEALEGCGVPTYCEIYSPRRYSNAASPGASPGGTSAPNRDWAGPAEQTSARFVIRPSPWHVVPNFSLAATSPLTTLCTHSSDSRNSPLRPSHLPPLIRLLTDSAGRRLSTEHWTVTEAMTPVTSSSAPNNGRARTKPWRGHRPPVCWFPFPLHISRIQMRSPGALDATCVAMKSGDGTRPFSGAAGRLTAFPGPGLLGRGKLTSPDPPR